MTDIMAGLKAAGYQPEKVEDTSFEPFKGKYECVVDEAARITGNNKQTQEPYDYRRITMKVVTVVEGDKAINRYLKRSYNNDAAGMEKLLNDLHTAGWEFAGGTDTEVDAFLPTLKDKNVKASAWITKEFTAKDGTTVPGGKQTCRIVHTFKLAGDKSAKEVKGEKAPF